MAWRQTPCRIVALVPLLLLVVVDYLYVGVDGASAFIGRRVRRRGRAPLGAGIFAAAGPGIRPAELPTDANIVQLPATLLALAGLAAPGMDGEALCAVLDLDDSAEVALSTPVGVGNASEGTYSADEAAEIVERLRDLGYE